MTKLLDYENPLMQVLNQIGRLIWLNFLTVLCSLPVITAGAALTALDSQILRLVRHEERYYGGIFPGFPEKFPAGNVYLVDSAGVLWTGGCGFLLDNKAGNPGNPSPPGSGFGGFDRDCTLCLSHCGKICKSCLHGYAERSAHELGAAAQNSSDDGSVCYPGGIRMAVRGLAAALADVWIVSSGMAVCNAV